MELEINKEYPMSLPIDYEKYGPHTSARFTVINHARNVFQDCRYERADFFSMSNGQLVSDVVFYRLQA